MKRLVVSRVMARNGEGGRGPALAGVFGRQVFLNNGQTVKADEAYLRESIVNPQAKLVDGFGPIMPTFQGQITEEQLVQILAFIKVAAGRRAPRPKRPAASAATPAPARVRQSGNRRQQVDS